MLGNFLFQKNFIIFVEQRYCIKFCQKLGGAQIETIRMIKNLAVLKLKHGFFQNRKQSREDIMQKLPEELRSIPKEQFQRTFQKWQKRWEKCVDL